MVGWGGPAKNTPLEVYDTIFKRSIMKERVRERERERVIEEGGMFVWGRLWLVSG